MYAKHPQDAQQQHETATGARREQPALNDDPGIEREIRELIETVSRRLAAVSDTPRLEADLLLARAIDMPRSYLFAHPDDQLDDGALERLMREVERRLEGEPLAYITGSREFWSLELMVTPATLVPRPETERLVELVLSEVAKDAPVRILDLGTGSGAIALAIAHERRMAEITATDVSAAALDVARQNARAVEVDNVRFVEGSWVEPVSGEQFDVVLSNPPYVAADDEALEKLGHEPQSALVAENDGLACILELAGAVPDVLAEDGLFFVEHGAAQAQAVENLLHDAGFEAIECFRDFAGLPRVTRAKRGA